MPGHHHIQVRTLLPCFAQCSSGTYAKCLGFVTCSDADRRIRIHRYNRRRLPAKVGLDLLLHRGKVRIHVQKEPIDLFRYWSGARHEEAKITRIENKKQIQYWADQRL